MIVPGADEEQLLSLIFCLSSLCPNKPFSGLLMSASQTMQLGWVSSDESILLTKVKKNLGMFQDSLEIDSTRILFGCLEKTLWDISHGLLIFIFWSCTAMIIIFTSPLVSHKIFSSNLMLQLSKKNN